MTKEYDIKAVLHTATPKTDVLIKTAFPKTAGPADGVHGTVIPQTTTTTSQAKPTTAPPSPKGD